MKKFIKVTGYGHNKQHEAILEVLNETNATFTTREIFSIGLTGFSVPERSKKEIIWRKRTGYRKVERDFYNTFKITQEGLNESDIQAALEETNHIFLN